MQPKVGQGAQLETTQPHLDDKIVAKYFFVEIPLLSCSFIMSICMIFIFHIHTSVATESLFLAIVDTNIHLPSVTQASLFLCPC